MKGEVKIPELRLKSDNGSEFPAWKEKRFYNVFNFTTGKNIKQKEASPEFNIPCVRYGELYHMYSEVIYKIINKTNLDKSELLFSKGDEILLPSAGEDPLDIGSASALTLENIAIGRTINILRPKQKNVYWQIFVAYYINQVLKKEIAKLARGASISNVYNSDLRKLFINLPSLPEQKKIADFLSTVDQRLDAITRRHDLLQQYKKGLLQTLFPRKGQTVPELRFKDDDGEEFPEWEEKKLGESLTIGSGKDYKHLQDGSIPVYGSGGLMLYVNDFLYEGESVGIGRKGTIDKPVFLSGKFWTVDTLFYTHSFKDCLPKFVYYLFLNINWKKYNEAGGVPSLSKSTINSITINFPSLREQKKISYFLSQVDHKLDSVASQIEQMKTWKRGLLQKMFV